jgi:hypothetical protein
MFNLTFSESEGQMPKNEVTLILTLSIEDAQYLRDVLDNLVESPEHTKVLDMLITEIDSAIEDSK